MAVPKEPLSFGIQLALGTGNVLFPFTQERLNDVSKVPSPNSKP